jgi:hypothetical protein
MATAAPDATPTPITPPYVPIIDPRTGNVHQAWYMFFLSLFRGAQAAQDPNLAPQLSDVFADIGTAAQAAQLAGQQGAASVSDVAALQTAVQALALADQVSATRDELAALSTMVQGLALNPAPVPRRRARYGSFYDTTTQTAGTINTATAITFNTTDLSNGVTIGSPTSRIVVDTEGIYNFQTSIQLDSTVATAQEFYLWFRLNGVDVTNSASQARVQGNNAEVFLALNYFFNLKAGDYVELMFSVSNLGVQLLASGPVAPHPGIPSIILTVANNINVVG